LPVNHSSELHEEIDMGIYLAARSLAGVYVKCLQHRLHHGGMVNYDGLVLAHWGAHRCGWCALYLCDWSQVAVDFRVARFEMKVSNNMILESPDG